MIYLTCNNSLGFLVLMVPPPLVWGEGHKKPLMWFLTSWQDLPMLLIQRGVWRCEMSTVWISTSEYWPVSVIMWNTSTCCQSKHPECVWRELRSHEHQRSSLVERSEVTWTPEILLSRAEWGVTLEVVHVTSVSPVGVKLAAGCRVVELYLVK